MIFLDHEGLILFEGIISRAALPAEYRIGVFLINNSFF